MDEKGDKMTKLSMNKFINMTVSDMNRRSVMEPNFDKYPLGKGQNENKVTFQEFQDGEQSMNCPICGFECTHITGVEVFARGEDAADHVHTAVDMEEMSTKVENVKGHGRNPSGRRDGLILSGHCETGCEFEIEIAQHKGNTFFKSTKTGEKKFD